VACACACACECERARRDDAAAEVRMRSPCAPETGGLSTAALAS
jgi:hypothetical protein